MKIFWSTVLILFVEAKNKATLKMAQNLAVTRPTRNMPLYYAEKDPTVLLVWFADGDQNMLERMGRHCGGCWLTHNRTFEHTAAGIIFDNTKHLMATKGYYNGLPDYARRNRDRQYWVWWPREAASKGFQKGTDWSVVKQWDGAFNLTASYRRDSDITRHWGSVDQLLYNARFSGRHEITFDKHMLDLMAKKTKVNHTAWFVSNCDHTNGANARWDYALKLIEAGLKLDGYGECFHRRLRNGTAPWSKGGLLEKYKFYLAFENSIYCNDYISEKFWRNALSTGAVPIVFGPWKQDVIDIAPVKSFIHVDDFASAADLVEFVDYLAHNDTAYMEYHAWRAEKPIMKNVPKSDKTGQMACDLSRKQAGWPKRIIESVASYWWMNVHDRRCIGSETIIPEWLSQLPITSMATSYDELNNECNK